MSRMSAGAGIKPMALAMVSALGLGLASLSFSPLPVVHTVEEAEAASWPQTARIATPWDYPPGSFASWEEAIDQAVADGANVILDWHAVSDRWQALYEPLLSQDLAEMAYHADHIHTHYPGVRYIVYVAPLEYVTSDVDQDQDGRVDPGKEGESLALQHPDWAQGRDRRPEGYLLRGLPGDALLGLRYL